MFGKWLVNSGLKFAPFFEPIQDGSQISLNLFGTIRLSSLELRPQAINDLNLDLDLNIIRGHFGNIEVELSLLKRQVRVLVEDIYIFATLNTTLSEDAGENRMKVVKKARLAADEAVRVAKKQIEEKVKEELGADADNGKPAVAAIIASFLRGVHVTVNRIHIRIEDTFTRPERPVSLGVCISKVEIKKTPDEEEIKSEHWRSKLTVAQTSVYVEAVSVYLDSDLPDGSYELLDRGFQTRAFAADIARDDDSEHRFVVHPLYVNVCAAIDCNALLGGLPADRERGVVSARVEIPAVKVSADPEQLVNLMGFGAFFGARETFIRHGRLRPKVSIKQDPTPATRRAWWHYAMALVREEVLKRAKPWRWVRAGMTDHQRQHERREYAEIWSRFMDSEEKEAKKALSGSEEKRLREIEESDRYTFEDIVFFRDFGENPIWAARRGDLEVTDKSGCLPGKGKKKKKARAAYGPPSSPGVVQGLPRVSSFEDGRPPTARTASVTFAPPPRDDGTASYAPTRDYAPTLAPTTMTARTNMTAMSTFTVSGVPPDRMPGMISFAVELKLVAVTLFKPPPPTPSSLGLPPPSLEAPGFSDEGRLSIPGSKSTRLLGAPVPVMMPPRTPVLGVEVRAIGASGRIQGRLGGAIGLISADVAVGGLYILDRSPLRAARARPFISTDPVDQRPTHDRDGKPLARPDFVSAHVKVYPPPGPNAPGGLVDAEATVRTLRVNLSMELVVDLVNSLGPLMTVRPPPKVVYTKANPKRQAKTARAVNDAEKDDFVKKFELPEAGQLDEDSQAFVAVKLSRVEVGPIIVTVYEQPPVDKAAASGLAPPPPPPPARQKLAGVLVWIEKIEVVGQIINKEAFCKVLETRELQERELELERGDGASVRSKPIPQERLDLAQYLDPGVDELYTCFDVVITGIAVDILPNIKRWRSVMADRRPVHLLQPFAVSVGFWAANAQEKAYLKAVVHPMGIAVSPAKIRSALAVVNSLVAYVPLLQLPPPAPGPPPDPPPPSAAIMHILAKVEGIVVQVLQDAPTPNGYRMPLLRIGVKLPRVHLMTAEGALGLRAAVELDGKCWHPDTHVWEVLIEPWDIEAIIKLVPGTYGNPTASIEASTEKAFCINVNPAMIANLAAFGALAGALVAGAAAPLPRVDHIPALPADVPPLQLEDEDAGAHDIDLDDDVPPPPYPVDVPKRIVPTDATSTTSGTRYDKFLVNSDSQRYIPLSAVHGDRGALDALARRGAAGPGPARPGPAVAMSDAIFPASSAHDDATSLFSGSRPAPSAALGASSRLFPAASGGVIPSVHGPLVGPDARAHILTNKTGLPISWRFVRGMQFNPERRQDLETRPPNADFRTTEPGAESLIERDEEEDRIAAGEAESGDAFYDETTAKENEAQVNEAQVSETQGNRRFLVFYIRPPRSEDGRWYPIPGRVPIGRPGLYVLRLPGMPSEIFESARRPILGATGARDICVDVERISDGGRTRLVLRAPIIIRNKTPIAMEVRVRPTKDHRVMIQKEIAKRKEEEEQERIYRGGAPVTPPTPAALDSTKVAVGDAEADLASRRRYSLSAVVEQGKEIEWKATLAPNVRGAATEGFESEAAVPLLLTSGELQVRPHGSTLEWSEPHTFFSMTRFGRAVAHECARGKNDAGSKHYPHGVGFCCYTKYSEESFLRQLGGEVPDDPMVLALVPALSIRSHLPFAALVRLVVGSEERFSGRLEAGQKLSYMHTIKDIQDLKISVKVDDPKRYPQAAFSKEKHVASHRDGASTFVKAPVLGELSLPVYMRTRDEKTRGKPKLPVSHTRKVTLFVPFWIVNRSGVNLLAKDPGRAPGAGANHATVRLAGNLDPQAGAATVVDLPDGNASAFPLCTASVKAKQGDPYTGQLALGLNEQNAALSKAINLMGAEDQLYVAVPQFAGGVSSAKGGATRVLEFGVRITAMDPTRVVVIDARFVLVNKSAPAGLLVRQEGDQGLAVRPLGKEKTEVFQWPRPVPQGQPRRIQIALPPPSARRNANGEVEVDGAALAAAQWSVPFALEEADVFHVPLRVAGDPREKPIRISVEKNGPSYYAFFDSEPVPPLVVRNECGDASCVLRFWQKGAPESTAVTVELGAERPFILENPKGPKVLMMEIVEAATGSVRRREDIVVEKLGFELLDRDVDPGPGVAALVAVVKPRGFQKLCLICIERDPRKLRRAKAGSAAAKREALTAMGTAGSGTTEESARLQSVRKGDALAAARALVQKKRAEAIAAAERRDNEGLSQHPPSAGAPPESASAVAGGASGAMEVELRAFIPAVKVSVNSDNARELLLVSLEAIQAKVKASASKQEVEAIVKHFQIDQMLSRRPAFGVFIGPQHKPVTYTADTNPLQYKDVVKDTDGIPPKPMIYFAATVLPPAGPDQANSDVLYLEEVTVELEPLDIRIHEDVLTEIVSSYAIKLLGRMKARRNAISRHASENCRAGAQLLSAVRAAGAVDTRPTAATATGKRIYIERLRISKIRLLLTIKAGPAAAHELIQVSEVVRRVVESLGSAILNIEKATIDLPAYDTGLPLFGLPGTIAGDIVPVYIAAGLKAGLSIVGSMALNPWILVRGFGRGIKAFYHEASEGVGSGAEPEGGGAAAGGKAAAVTWVCTLAQWYSGVADAIGNGVDKLGSKNGFFHNDLEYYRNKVPMRALKGFKQGTKMAYCRLADAAFGVVQIPIDGSRKRGFFGFVGGVFAGAVNLVAQPLTGLLEVNGKTFQGAANSMSDDWHMHHDGRLRRARACGVRLSIAKFDPANSEAQENLVAYKLVKPNRDVRMFDDRVICEHDAVYITNELLVYLNADTKSDSWTAPWADVYQAQYVEEADTIASVEGVRVVLDGRPPRVRFIPCKGERAQQLAKEIQTKINAVIWGYRWTARFPDLKPPPV
eukprot:tig00020554_g10931.t1